MIVKFPISSVIFEIRKDSVARKPQKIGNFYYYKISKIELDKCELIDIGTDVYSVGHSDFIEVDDPKIEQLFNF